MIDYLDKLKRALLKKITIFFIIFFIISALFLFIPLRENGLHSLLIYESVYCLIYTMAYFFFRFMLCRIGDKTLRSQEIISRSISKNTPTIINNISHELRTPLNAIMGFAESLYDTEENLERKEALLAVKDNSDRLFSMANKLIDFFSIETGEYYIDYEYMRNEFLLENLKNIFDTEIEKKGLKLNIINEIPGHLGILTDFNALFEILEMLIENAVKFTEKGSVTIRSTYNNRTLFYSISDTGTGVPEDKKKIIFELYRQGNSEMDRNYEGQGLGLTIAEKLTEMLGGTLSLRDNCDHGTCFEVRIKADSREITTDSEKDYTFIIPIDLNGDEQIIMARSADKLTEYIKVFNSAKIRLLAEELGAVSEKFKILAERLISTADTYNELEFSQIVEKMKKGATDED